MRSRRLGFKVGGRETGNCDVVGVTEAGMCEAYQGGKETSLTGTGGSLGECRRLKLEREPGARLWSHPGTTELMMARLRPYLLVLKNSTAPDIFRRQRELGRGNIMLKTSSEVYLISEKFMSTL